MSGHVGDLNHQQEEALMKFRRAVAHLPDKPEDDDYFYLRWLRAQKFDTDKAEDMLKKHLECRKKFGVDTLMDWTPPEVLVKYFPGGFFGEDREGHPVWYDNIGGMDFRGLHRSVSSMDEIMKYKFLHGERAGQLCREASEKKGRRIETIVVVIDFEKLSLTKHRYWPGIEMIRKVLTQHQYNYPERVKLILFVKAPSYFPFCYNFVKPFIDPETQKKIKILGSGSNWQEEIQTYISPDNLPQAYGGTRCEPDSWCTDYINNGGDVPEKYYLTNISEAKKEEMKKVVVGARRAHRVVCEVPQPHSVLKWEFFTAEYDIAYGVHHYNSSTPKDDLVPLKRRDSHIVPQIGFVHTEKHGKHVFLFDNSYSWMRHKELYYSVTILPPGSEPADEFSGALATGGRPMDVNPNTGGTETGLTTEEKLYSANPPKFDKVTTEGP